MERILQEKTSADHLLYVSLKYTKTTDVMLNLLARWTSLIEASIDKLLEHAKHDKKIKELPEAPKIKVEKIKELYKKNSDIIDTIELYEFFKRVPNLEKTRENEFRKHVTLRVMDKGEWIVIDMDKLKEYSEKLERFISNLRQIF